jgi:predicted ATPase/Tfp pilus assembly protein PilF
MRQLPTGTVTFLFTDIEGSTRLLQEHGDRYAELLVEHRRVLREAFERHSGVEVDTEGDAFFVALASAREAVAAAAEAQAALGDGPIQVRIGLHTGEAQVVDGTYVGLDIHRAARIAAAGHGGQVLLSASTRALVDVQLDDLGEHRLKDLLAPQRLYQLAETRCFPPLKSIYQTNLPVPATPFLGRERELAEITDLLSHTDTRLLTLTGAGGAGKTRLALQAAAETSEQYPDGVWWVGLASLQDPALVLPTVAHVLGATDDLVQQVGHNHVLVLLDNLEQLLDCVPQLSALLDECPRLVLLVTSREPLHLTREHRYAVPPLGEADAVSLFTQRAQALRSDFETNGGVTEICRRLDHLPLAIELAAARVAVLSPRQLLERLEQRLPLLTGGASDMPSRQRTLRATIEWSYDLLNAEEQALFARLSVFAGGGTLEAAEVVCGADLDTLQSLVDKSLLRHTGERFWMLETMREFAAHALNTSNGGHELRRRHASWFLTLAETSEARLKGADGPEWLERLDREHDNMRAALAWSLETGDSNLALRLAGALHGYWYHRSHFAEGRHWAELALSESESSAPSLREKALGAAGELALHAGDPAAARAFLTERLELCEGLEDQARLSEALTLLGHLAASEGNLARARELYERSLRIVEERQEWTGWQAPGIAHSNLGWAMMRQGDLDEARAVLDRGLSLAHASETRLVECTILQNLGWVALQTGNAGEVTRLVIESLRLQPEMPDKRVSLEALELLAAASAISGDHERAARLTGATCTLRTELSITTEADPVPGEDLIAAARSRVGEASWREEHERGERMSLSDAFAYATDPRMRTIDQR